MSNSETSDQVVKKRVGRPQKDPTKSRRERRYNLALSESDFETVKKIAEDERTSFLQVIQRFVRVGIMIYNAVRQDKGQVILRKKTDDGRDDDQQILML